MHHSMDETLIWFGVQNVVLLVQFFTGLVLMVISFIMGVINSTSSINSLLKVSEFLLCS